MTKNKGYTLMEMMIVIAIMGILTGVSFVVLGVINQARCTAAVNTLNNQMSNCLVKTKAVSKVDTPTCMVIAQRTDGCYAIMMSTLDEHGNLPVTLDPNKDENCEAILAKQIKKITYTPSATEQTHPQEMVLQFVKNNGSVRYGAGQYDLYTGDGTELYASIYVDKVSGTHYIK